MPTIWIEFRSDYQTYHQYTKCCVGNVMLVYRLRSKLSSGIGLEINQEDNATGKTRISVGITNEPLVSIAVSNNHFLASGAQLLGHAFWWRQRHIVRRAHLSMVSGSGQSRANRDIS